MTVIIAPLFHCQSVWGRVCGGAAVPGALLRSEWREVASVCHCDCAAMSLCRCISVLSLTLCFGGRVCQVHSCVQSGGKVLIPVFALGRAQVSRRASTGSGLLNYQGEFPV